MTKEEIRAMEAGKELDAIIDKEIFGGDDCVHDLYWVALDEYTCAKCHKQFCSPEPYSYSTDISSAWQVVEKLRSMEDGEGNSLLCCLEIYSDHDLCWDIYWSYSELGNQNDGHKKHRLPVSYDEFPEAICKAALIIKLEGAAKTWDFLEKRPRKIRKIKEAKP